MVLVIWSRLDQEDQKTSGHKLDDYDLITMMTMVMMSATTMIRWSGKDKKDQRRKMFQVATCGVWLPTTDGCSEEPR